VPKYINKSSNPVYFGNSVFTPNQEVETLDTLVTRAFIVGTKLEPYNIQVGVNDLLMIKFNEETTWTNITLTDGVAQTAADIAADIEAVYSGVASDEGGKLRLDTPVVNNVLNSVYVATGGTANGTIGLPTNDSNPVSSISLQAFKVSTNSEVFNVTSANNVFIFKVNNYGNWIIATLTIGAAQTAAQIAADINTAYEIATADATKIAFAVTIDGSIYVKLISPIYNNFQSRLYIKLTHNTALSLLGFSGDNFDPISQSSYPSLIKTSVLPLYNPMISETIITFAAAGEQHYYLVDPDACKSLQLIRVSGGGGIKYTVYLEDITNTPPFTLVVLEAFTVDLTNKRISKLVIVSSGIGTITIRELKS
jgi:hypothetical protein